MTTDTCWCCGGAGIVPRPDGETSVEPCPVCHIYDARRREMTATEATPLLDVASDTMPEPTRAAVSAMINLLARQALTCRVCGVVTPFIGGPHQATCRICGMTWDPLARAERILTQEAEDDRWGALMERREERRREREMENTGEE